MDTFVNCPFIRLASLRTHTHTDLLHASPESSQQTRGFLGGLPAPYKLKKITLRHKEFMLSGRSLFQQQPPKSLA